MKSILGICGAPSGRSSKSFELLERALAGAREQGVITGREVLAEGEFSITTIQKKIRNADGLIIATPTHWFNVSILTKRLIDEVFWDFSDTPFELEGMPLGIIANCDEDGANQAIASIAMPLNHCGLFVPPFGTLIHNTSMPGHGENGWQNDAEYIGKQIAKYVLK